MRGACRVVERILSSGGSFTAFRMTERLEIRLGCRCLSRIGEKVAYLAFFRATWRKARSMAVVVRASGFCRIVRAGCCSLPLLLVVPS